MVDGLIFAALLAAAVWLDGLARPRVARRRFLGGRSLAGGWLLVWLTTALFGLFLAGSGNAVLAGSLTLALLALFVVVSNAKYAVLGEPLLFTDLALVGAIFRHPQFYLAAIETRQRIVAAAILAALVVGIGWLFVPAPRSHLAGLAMLGYVSEGELAAAIRQGELDDRYDEVKAAVVATVQDKLKVANPDYE
jgi:hypothetical protein